MKKIALLLLFWAFVSQALTVSSEVPTTVPDTVRIGAYVMNIYDINFRDKEYSIKFWVWMKYKNPEIDFLNTIEIPGSKEVQKPDVMSYKDSASGEIWTLIKLNCKMSQSWNVSDYPFDTQNLQLRIENNKFDTRYLVLIADTTHGESFDPLFNVDGWAVKKFNTRLSAHKYNTNFGDVSLAPLKTSTYATFNLEFELARNASGLFMKLFVGMYIAFLISCVSFLVHADHVEPRFALPVGGLFASVGNKYIIDSILPETNEFTLVDSLHTTTFIAIFLTIAISSISLILYGEDDLKRSNNFDKWGGISICTIYAVINIILITKSMY
jgi:hypothetical protein